MTKREEREQIEQEIRDLQSKLNCTTSEIGDWKIAKCFEYQLDGLPAPYDIKDLHKKRQAVRDEINAIQQKLESDVDSDVDEGTDEDAIE